MLINSLRAVQRAAYPFKGRAMFGDDHLWSTEVPGSDDLPNRVQGLLDELSVVSGGSPTSGASLTWPAIDRIYLDLQFILHRVVATWAECQGMDPAKVSVDFALSVSYMPIIENATYLDEDISSRLRDSMVTYIPLDHPVVYFPTEPLTQEDIARVVRILDSLAEES